MRISEQVFQENKARQIFRKTNISYPVRVRIRRCFLETAVLRFALLPNYRRNHIEETHDKSDVADVLNFLQRKATR